VIPDKHTHLNTFNQNLHPPGCNKELEGVGKAVDNIVDKLHGFGYHQEPLWKSVFDYLDEKRDKTGPNNHVASRSMRRNEGQERYQGLDERMWECGIGFADV
jgi:hypothetical protein